MHDDDSGPADAPLFAAGAALAVGCLPALPADLAARLQAGGRLPLTLRPLVDLEQGLAGPDHALVLLAAELPMTATELVALAARCAVVLHVADDPPGSADGSWSAAISAGVQDVLTRAELSTPAAALRLHAAALRHRLAARARQAYSTDLSTGLPHRQQLLEHLSQLLALRRREPAPTALLVLHVGPGVPPTAAIAAEDAAVVRRKLAVRLRSGLRASDVVASLGDGQFAVLLASVEAATDVEVVLAKLIGLARRPLLLAGQPVGLDIRCGIARYPEDGDDAAVLLQHAQRQAGSAGARSSDAATRSDAANDPRG